MKGAVAGAFTPESLRQRRSYSCAIGANSSVQPGASVGPQTAIGADSTIGARATLAGRLTHTSNPVTIGDDVIVARRATIGADHILGTGTTIGRAVSAGPDLTTGANATVGYGAVLGHDVTLLDNATIGSLTSIGDYTTIGDSAVIARNVTVAHAINLATGSVIDGIIGPETAIGTNVSVVAGARVRKDVTLHDGATVEATGRVGRGSTVNSGATVEGTVRANAIIGANATVVDGAYVGRGAEVCGNTTVPDGAWVPSGGLYPDTGCGPAPSCKAILDAGGSSGDGVYTIDPDGLGGAAAFDVYCDMTTDSGGWALIQYGHFAGSNENDYGNPLVLSSPQATSSAKVQAMLDASPERLIRVHRTSVPANFGYFNPQSGYDYNKGSGSVGNLRFSYQTGTWSSVYAQTNPFSNRAGIATTGCTDGDCAANLCITTRTDGQGAICFGGGDNTPITLLLR